MGTAEGWKKLEIGKITSLSKNQMEELLEGPVFHIGPNGERDSYDELCCRTNAVGRLCARMHAGMPLVCMCA